MKKLIALTFAGLITGFAASAQSKSKKTSKEAVSTEHLGTWKLVSQKIKYENGQVLTSDSASVFLRKILTPTNFVVIVERKVPELNNKKLASSVSGGTYSLVNGDYQEFTKYAAFNDFDKMKVNYKLSIENGKLHTIGTIGGTEIYEEFYERVEW